MSIVLPVVAVVALAAFALAAATVSTIAAHRPGRAAGLLVLVAAGAAVTVAMLTMVGVGTRSLERALEMPAMRRSATVVYERGRLAAGLCAALGLLGLAAWLVRTGDWARVDAAEDPDGETT